MNDRHVIACNLRTPTKIAARGALCYVVLPNPGNRHERIVILVRSRYGRWVRKWEQIARLENFRPKTVPADNRALAGRVLWDFDVDKYVDRFNTAAVIARMEEHE